MTVSSSSEIKPEFHYVRLANELEEKVKAGTYRIGEKLPSIRQLHHRMGLSISTIYQTYIELEKREIIEAKPKSGYYVKAISQPLLPVPKMKKHRLKAKKVQIHNLVESIVASISNPDFLQLGCTMLSPELLPLKQFSRAIRSLSKRNMEDIVTYGALEGAPELRRQIAKRMIGNSNHVKEDEIIVTNGCMEALSLCLRAVAGAGDTIAVESPTFFSILQLIEDLGMYALEMPTSPQNGIDLDFLEKALTSNPIRACLLIPNFHNPLGCVIPDENKLRLVKISQKNNMPIIEDDIYGDLNFEEPRPTTLKFFDKHDNVLYCSSFSKTLAPGLRVGWTLPGKFAGKVKRLKLNSALMSPTLNHLIIADFLKSGSYDRHLRKLRNALKNQMRQTSLAIARHFPDGTMVTSPSGGFMLWVELDRSIDSFEVYQEALRHNISVIPGVICSNSNKYSHFIRISCGLPWSEKLQQGVIRIGEIIHQLTRACR